VFQPLPGWKPAASRQLKLAVLSACIDLWLRELKEASFTGVDIADPWGVMQRVYVRLVSYVADQPEIYDISCVKGGKQPCEQCLVGANTCTRAHGWMDGWITLG
jgi:hypothetical protein